MIIKRIFCLFLLLSVYANALADRSIERLYGAATTVNICLPDFADPKVYQATWTVVDADVKLSKDEGAFTTIGAADVTHEGEGCWSAMLTATEMQCARCVLKFQDAATQVITDSVVIIETYGHPSAQNIYGFEPVVASGITNATGTTTTTDLTGGSTVDDTYNGYTLKVFDDSLDLWYEATITNYVGSTEVATHTAILNAAVNLDGWVVTNERDAILNCVNGICESKVISLEIAAIVAGSFAADAIGDGAIDGAQTELASASALATAQIDLDTLTGSDGATLATSQPNYAPAKAGDSMALTAAAVDLIWNELLETAGTTYTARCLLAAVLAYGAGEWTQSGSVITYQDPGGNLNRIVGTIQSPGFNTITITCP